MYTCNWNCFGFGFILWRSKNKYHPTAWIGGFIAKLTPFAKNQNQPMEKLGGVLIVTIVSGIVILLLLMLILVSLWFLQILSC